MSVFKEIPPTAGIPLSLGDFLPVLAFPKSRDQLEQDFRDYLGVDFARVAYSGTASFYLILEALKEESLRKKVVVPAYICPLVPLAVKRAGLEVEVCDVGPQDFNFDLKQLEEICRQGDILAVVPTHLAGIPVDLGAIGQIAKKYGIFIIEDCAQSLGAQYQGRKTGTLGDFSFFSLCRGKGLTIYEGGAISTSCREYRGLIDKKIKELVKNDFLSESLKIMELFGYWMFYRPFFFWYIFRLPQIFWNLQGKGFRAQIEEFDLNFAMHEVSNFRKLVGHFSFSRLEQQIKLQRQKAAYYLQGLKQVKGVTVIQEQAGDKASYPYLTLVFDDRDKRNAVLKKGVNLGLGVGKIYDLAITDYPYLKVILPQRQCPGARFIAERELTLSTSVFLSQKDLDSIIAMIKE